MIYSHSKQGKHLRKPTASTKSGTMPSRAKTFSVHCSCQANGKHFLGLSGSNLPMTSSWALSVATCLSQGQGAHNTMLLRVGPLMRRQPGRTISSSRRLCNAGQPESMPWKVSSIKVTLYRVGCLLETRKIHNQAGRRTAATKLSHMEPAMGRAEHQ